MKVRDNRFTFKFNNLILALMLSGSTITYAAMIPLEFSAKPKYPITLDEGQSTVLYYTLRNNTPVMLPLSFSLTPKYLTIAMKGNTCGNSINANSSCILPINFTAPVQQNIANYINGSLTINYQGRSPLIDDSIQFNVNQAGALTVQVDPTSSHLQYKKLLVQNLSSSPGAIRSVSFSSGLSSMVSWCEAGNTSCDYQSTCVLNNFINPGESCFLWFKSNDNSSFALGSTSGTLTVSTDNANSNFNVNYMNNLFVGGFFDSSPTSSSPHIGSWNGTSWNPLGTGTDAYVDALTIYKGDLIAGGNFSTAGGNSASHIASWNGSSWSPFIVGTHNGVTNVVISLITFNGNLYAGGEFTNAGGITANHIAKWNGSQWTALGAGFSGGGGQGVESLAYIGNTLYAGGSFTASGTISINNIASWNGSSWSQVGTNGLNEEVVALFVNQGNLYAGGYFTSSASTGYIAKFSGNNWSILAHGTDNPVFAISGLNNTLYIGGLFTQAGANPSITAHYLVKFSAGSYSAISGPQLSGISPAVSALAPAANTMYVGGFFNNAGSITLNNIGALDTTTDAWSPLGGGTNGDVYALLVASSLDLSNTG